MIFAEFQLHFPNIKAQTIFSCQFGCINEMINLLILIQILVHIVFLLSALASPQKVPVIALGVSKAMGFED
jgi:hypothetical protein